MRLAEGKLWGRLSVAFGVSAAFNIAMVIGLVGMHGGSHAAAPPVSRRVPLSIIDQPPPPPPPPPPPAETTESMDAPPRPAEPMPALEMPAVEGDAQGLALPPSNDELDWDVDRSMPQFKGAGTKPESLAAGATPATLLHPPELARYYPRRAATSRVTGTTLLELDVDASGAVSEVRIVSSEPTGIFERAARRVARRLRYKPASRDGRPMLSKVRLELKWQVPK